MYCIELSMQSSYLLGRCVLHNMLAMQFSPLFIACWTSIFNYTQACSFHWAYIRVICSEKFNAPQKILYWPPIETRLDQKHSKRPINKYKTFCHLFNDLCSRPDAVNIFWNRLAESNSIYFFADNWTLIDLLCYHK